MCAHVVLFSHLRGHPHRISCPKAPRNFVGFHSACVYTRNIMMGRWKPLRSAAVLSCLWACAAQTVDTEDLRLPGECLRTAQEGDHLMIKYEIKVHRTGDVVYSSPDKQTVHVVLGGDDVIAGLNMGLEGMCENSTRRVTVPPQFGYAAKEFRVGPPMVGTQKVASDATLDFVVSLERVTKGEEYAIFDALEDRNVSAVLDLIEGKKGINAVDAYGATPLMIAVSLGMEVVAATLLNAARPWVDVNAQKPSGYSALFYAAANPRNPSLVRALLQRGADPNLTIEAGENRGYSPLHFAARFGAHRNALALLERGAHPNVAAADGSTQLDLATNLSPSRDRDQLVFMLKEAIAQWNKVNERGLPSPQATEL